MKKYDFALYKELFALYIVLNLLTFPLSPYAGGGWMKQDVYDIILYVKLVILASFAVIGACMLISNMIFLKQQKTANK